MKIEDEIKQTHFASEFHKAHLNLIFTSNWLMNQSKAITKKYGITAQQYNVLRILKGRHPKTYAAGQIKEVMLERSSDITRLVDRLLLKGLVTRGECATNRRQMDIGITKKGMALLDLIHPEMKETFDKNQNISRTEAKELNRILNKMRE